MFCMIYINSHEPQEIINLLRNKTEICVKNFTPGDYIIGNNGIERKTINDFLSSLVQKRLFEQLTRLKVCYQNCLLIIEAFDLSHFSNTTSIYGVILKLMMDMNIKVIFSQTKEQSADILYILDRRIGNKVYNKELLNYQLKYKNRDRPLSQKQLLMLQAIPNVGVKRARLLLNKFGRIKDIFEADDKTILSVEGIGNKTIKNLRKMLETKT